MAQLWRAELISLSESTSTSSQTKHTPCPVGSLSPRKLGTMKRSLSVFSFIILLKKMFFILGFVQVSFSSIWFENKTGCKLFHRCITKMIKSHDSSLICSVAWMSKRGRQNRLFFEAKRFRFWISCTNTDLYIWRACPLLIRTPTGITKYDIKLSPYACV